MSQSIGAASLHLSVENQKFKQGLRTAAGDWLTFKAGIESAAIDLSGIGKQSANSLFNPATLASLAALFASLRTKSASAGAGVKTAGDEAGRGVAKLKNAVQVYTQIVNVGAGATRDLAKLAGTATAAISAGLPRAISNNTSAVRVFGDNARNAYAVATVGANNAGAEGKRYFNVLGNGAKQSQAALKATAKELPLLRSGIGSLSGLVAPLAIGTAGIFTGMAFGAFKFGAAAIEAASSVEDLLVDFKVMLGSATEAKKLFGDIKQLADATPFEPTELANAAKLLLSVGVNARDMTGVLTALGDVAGGSAERLKAVVSIYSQAANTGKVTGETLNRLAENNIALTSNLAKVLGVSASEVAGLASENKISFVTLQKAINDATGEGGRFFGLMDQKSRTLSGLLSTLKGNWEGFLAAAGQIAIDEFGLKSLVAGLASGLDSATKNAEALRPMFRQIAQISGHMAKSGLLFAESIILAGASLADSVKTADKWIYRAKVLWNTVTLPGQIAADAILGQTQTVKMEGDPQTAYETAKQMIDALRKGFADFGTFGQRGTFTDEIWKSIKADGVKRAAEAGGILGLAFKKAFENSGKIKLGKEGLTADQIKLVADLRKEFDPLAAAMKDIDQLKLIRSRGGFGDTGIAKAANQPLFDFGVAQILEKIAGNVESIDLRASASAMGSVDAVQSIVDAQNQRRFASKPEDKIVEAINRQIERQQAVIDEARRLRELFEGRKIPVI